MNSRCSNTRTDTCEFFTSPCEGYQIISLNTWLGAPASQPVQSERRPYRLVPGLVCLQIVVDAVHQANLRGRLRYTQIQRAAAWRAVRLLGVM
jgi:hypothetical protein